MDIGADLFLHMMKGIYPGYTEAFSKKSMEFFQNGSLYVSLMDTVLEAIKAIYAGKGSDEDLNEIYNKISQHYLKFYQENMGKYLGAPQFGISREALHQIMIAVDSYHIFMGAVGDFMLKFSTPLKKSMEILQQKIKNKEESDDSFQTAKEVYNFIVSILDTEYDEWLKSPEGVKSVVNMVEKYLEYKQASNPVRDKWLRSLSIPTKREMEDVYRGIYDLKKKTRKQDEIIREQSDIIKTLNRKLQALETSLSGALPKKKPSASSVAQRRVKSKASARVPQKAKMSRKRK